MDGFWRFVFSLRKLGLHLADVRAREHFSSAGTTTSVPRCTARSTRNRPRAAVLERTACR